MNYRSRIKLNIHQYDLTQLFVNFNGHINSVLSSIDIIKVIQIRQSYTISKMYEYKCLLGKICSCLSVFVSKMIK